MKSQKSWFRRPHLKGLTSWSEKRQGSPADLLSECSHMERIGGGDQISVLLTVTFNVQRPWPFTWLTLLLLFFSCSSNPPCRSQKLKPDCSISLTDAHRSVLESIYSVELWLFWGYLEIPERMQWKKVVFFSLKVRRQRHCGGVCKGILPSAPRLTASLLFPCTQRHDKAQPCQLLLPHLFLTLFPGNIVDIRKESSAEEIRKCQTWIITMWV